jgi:FkbM family methyltransferase
MLKIFIKILNKFGCSLYLDSKHIITSYYNKTDKICIFDIGAHKGESTRVYSRLFPNSKIFAFEPYLGSFKELKKFRSKKIKVFNLGFSSSKKIKKIFVNKNSSTNSIMPFEKEADNVWGGRGNLKSLTEVKCKLTTLDQFLFEKKIDKIDFLKIDVQGYEFEILKGAKKTLMAKKIKMVEIEFIYGKTYLGQKNIAFYFNFFEKCGYKLKNITDLVHNSGNIIQMQLFFLPK